MNLRRRRNERIHGVNGLTARFAAGDQSPPLIGDGAIYPDNSSFEPWRQLAAEPFIEPPTPCTRG